MIAIALLTSHLRARRSHWVFPDSSAVSNSDAVLLQQSGAVESTPHTPLDTALPVRHCSKSSRYCLRLADSARSAGILLTWIVFHPASWVSLGLLPVPAAKRIVYSPATPPMVVHFADFATPLSQTQFEFAALVSLPAYFCQFRPFPQVPLICNALLYSTAEAGTIPPLGHRTPTHPLLPPSPAADSPDGFSIVQTRT